MHILRQKSTLKPPFLILQTSFSSIHHHRSLTLFRYHLFFIRTEEGPGLLVLHPTFYRRNSLPTSPPYEPPVGKSLIQRLVSDSQNVSSPFCNPSLPTTYPNPNKSYHTPDSLGILTITLRNPKTSPDYMSSDPDQDSRTTFQPFDSLVTVSGLMK